MDYGDKVFKFLQDAKPGKTFTIKVICVVENTDAFIALVKEYMDMTPAQGGWSFNHDYSKIMKIDIDFKKQSLDKGIYNK